MGFGVVDLFVSLAIAGDGNYRKCYKIVLTLRKHKHLATDHFVVNSLCPQSSLSFLHRHSPDNGTLKSVCNLPHGTPKQSLSRTET